MNKQTVSGILAKRRRALWLTRKITTYQRELDGLDRELSGIDIPALLRKDIAEQKALLAQISTQMGRVSRK
jgi:hypothetical protein